MKDYEVSDYSIFGNAINTINNMNAKVDSFITSLSECKNIVDNDAVFMGPVADKCVSAINSSNTDMSSMKDSFSKLSSYVSQTSSNYSSGDSSASNVVLSTTGDTQSNSNGSNTSSSTGVKLKNSNVIDTSSPSTKGTKYNLTDDELKYLAYVSMKEQGSVEGAKVELSLMANLYEKNKSKYSSVTDYVKNSKWFASASTKNYKYPGDSYYEAAKEVLNNGNRYLPSNVVEHDCISDIKSVTNGTKGDRSSYVSGKTIIENKYGSKYVFVGFAPNNGDPFGYLV